MHDFSWTAQHDELPTRQRVLPLLEQAGYQPVSAAQPPKPNQRPRTILATADQRARAELIGPENVIFKATLLLAPTRDQTAADLREFLAALVPGWQGAAEWVDAALADQAAPEQSIRFRDLEITLKSANQQRLALGITWQP